MVVFGEHFVFRQRLSRFIGAQHDRNICLCHPIVSIDLCLSVEFNSSVFY